MASNAGAEAGIMVIALMNNLPELFGFVCAGGLGFYLGRKFERWKN